MAAPSGTIDGGLLDCHTLSDALYYGIPDDNGGETPLCIHVSLRNNYDCTLGKWEDVSPKGSPIRSISLLVELSYLYIREGSVLVLYSVLTILK